MLLQPQTQGFASWSASQPNHYLWNGIVGPGGPEKMVMMVDHCNVVCWDAQLGKWLCEKWVPGLFAEILDRSPPSGSSVHWPCNNYSSGFVLETGR
jgi:hypothetical protein